MPLLGSRRQGAEAYLFITVAALAVTVVSVRWFLEFTGYPKVGAAACTSPTCSGAGC